MHVECEDLIKHMLVVDADKRYTLRQVACHRWMHIGYEDERSTYESKLSKCPLFIFPIFLILLQTDEHILAIFSATIDNYCSRLDAHNTEDRVINPEILQHMVRLGLDPEQTIKVSVMLI